MPAVVYRITCTANGRCYIGPSTSYAGRRRGHLYSLRHGKHHSPHLQRTFNKHGEATLVWDILWTGPASEMLGAETAAIEHHRPAFNSAVQPGATRLGAKHSEESKAKMSAVQRAAGPRHTPASRAAIGRASAGNAYSAGRQNARKVTPEIRAEIWRLVGEGLGSYRVGKRVGLSKQTIINVRKGRH
jgi:group I intron endonuclease